MTFIWFLYCFIKKFFYGTIWCCLVVCPRSCNSSTFYIIYATILYLLGMIQYQKLFHIRYFWYVFIYLFLPLKNNFLKALYCRSHWGWHVNEFEQTLDNPIRARAVFSFMLGA